MAMTLKCPTSRSRCGHRPAPDRRGTAPAIYELAGRVVFQCAKPFFHGSPARSHVEMVRSVNTPTKTGLGAARRRTDVLGCGRTSPPSPGEQDHRRPPPRSGRGGDRVLGATARPAVQFDILSNPEFLAEGTAAISRPRPRVDRGKIEGGGKGATPLCGVRELGAERILRANLCPRALRLAANAFLAQISSINAMSALCEATSADVAWWHATGRTQIGPVQRLRRLRRVVLQKDI